MGVFYDPADFAVAVTRARPGEGDVAFHAIFGLVDTEVFGGHALAARRTLRWPAGADVIVDDVLTIDGVEYRVLETPRRIVDGAECEALLGAHECVLGRL